MLRHASKFGFAVLAVCFLASGNFDNRDRAAFGCAGGMGAGCGGGIGYSGSGYSGGGNSGGYGFGGYSGCGGYSVRSATTLSAGYWSSLGVDPWRPLAKPTQPAPDCVQLTVDVPADAKVFINDRPTTSTGTRRVYASSGLKTDAVYPYRVRAEFMRHGKPVSVEKVVPLTVGKSVALAFTAVTASQLANTSQGDHGHLD